MFVQNLSFIHGVNHLFIYTKLKVNTYVQSIPSEIYVTILHRAFENNESFLCDKDNFVGKLEYLVIYLFIFFRPKISCFMFVGREEFN